MMAVIAALVVWKPADGPLADPDMFFFVFLRGMVIFSTIYNIWFVANRIITLPCRHHAVHAP